MYGIMKHCQICDKEAIEHKSEDDKTYMRFDYICEKCAVKLKRLIDSADALIDAANADGCDGCKYTHKEMNDMPCLICKNRYTNQWTMRPKGVSRKCLK